jgi:hypothetical protein
VTRVRYGSKDQGALLLYGFVSLYEVSVKPDVLLSWASASHAKYWDRSDGHGPMIASFALLAQPMHATQSSTTTHRHITPPRLAPPTAD